jgi:hypothetical protein
VLRPISFAQVSGLRWTSFFLTLRFHVDIKDTAHIFQGSTEVLQGVKVFKASSLDGSGVGIAAFILSDGLV